MINPTRCLLLVILVLVGQSSAPLFAEQLKLTIKSSTIEIQEPIITVSHVANVISSDQHDVLTAGRLDLEEIQIGQTVTLTRSQILMRVRLANFDVQSIEIQGPRRITVKRTSTQNRVSRLKSLIANALSSQFGIPQADVQISIDESSLPQRAMDGGMGLETTVILPTELPLGKTRVRLLHRDSNNQEVDFELNCHISIMTDMLVATRNLSRGSELTAADYKVVKRPLVDRRLVPASPRDVTDKQTNTTIPVHGVIRLSSLVNVTRRNMVSRNDLVDVIYSGSGMNLRVRNAKVMTAGGKGDRVEVMNPESNKRVVARVVSESLVEIR